MSEPVMITLMICLTAAFISIIFALIIRWVCIVVLSNMPKPPLVDDKYLTIDEFEEYEHIVAEHFKNLEDQIGGPDAT